MTMQYDNLEDKLSQLVEYTKDSGKIDLSLYTEYDVKRGLSTFWFQPSVELTVTV
mgnify:CR=1 FL=1